MLPFQLNDVVTGLNKLLVLGHFSRRRRRAKVIISLAACNSAQPTRQLLGISQVPELLIHLEVNLLKHVGRYVAIMTDGKRDRENQPAIPRNKLLPRFLVAIDASLD